MKIEEWIIKILKENKDSLANQEYAIPGENGPYHQSETPVRNTAHWVISLLDCYELTGDEEFKKIACKLANYLKIKILNSKNGAIDCFDTTENENTANGLMGYAWVIEALIKVADAIGEAEYYAIAIRLFKSQKYDNKKHIWSVVDSKGINRGIDFTFNHNLWFAAMGYILMHRTNDESMKLVIDDFFYNWYRHIFVYNSGLLSHFCIGYGSITKNIKLFLRYIFIQISGKGTPWNHDNQMEYERAYHLFSMYAFATIYFEDKEFEFFKTKKFKKMCTYALNKDNFKSFPEKNQFAYFYNSPAFEYPYIMLAFGNNVTQEEIQPLLDKQREIFESKCESEVDWITLYARIYELLNFYTKAEGK